LATTQEFITSVVEQPGPQGAQPGLLIKVSKAECGMVADCLDKGLFHEAVLCIFCMLI